MSYTTPGPKTYRSKPTDVVAIQYDGTDVSESAIQDWVGTDMDGGQAFVIYNAVTQVAELYVAASDARCRMSPGDWVVAERNADGFYPVRKADFDERYTVPKARSTKSPQTRGSEGK